MSYKIELSEKTVKILDKMQKRDTPNFEMIVKHLKNLENTPMHYGKALTSHLKGLFSYRVGDFRIIYQIRDIDKTIFIVTIGHRRYVYE